MSQEVKIVFQPSGRTVHALPGTILLEAAARSGFIVHTPCGGAGTCGKCLVQIRSGNCPPTDGEITVLGEERITQGFRLACQARVSGPLTLDIPETSLIQTQQQILTEDSGEALEILPRVKKSRFTLASPSSETTSDLDRLRAAGVNAPISASALRTLPIALHSPDNTLTVVQVDDDVIAIEPGDTTTDCFGIAFDIGTTTLVGTLVNLMTGADLAGGALLAATLVAAPGLVRAVTRNAFGRQQRLHQGSEGRVIHRAPASHHWLGDRRRNRLRGRFGGTCSPAEEALQRRQVTGQIALAMGERTAPMARHQQANERRREHRVVGRAPVAPMHHQGQQAPARHAQAGPQVPLQQACVVAATTREQASAKGAQGGHRHGQSQHAAAGVRQLVEARRAREDFEAGQQHEETDRQVHQQRVKTAEKQTDIGRNVDHLGIASGTRQG